MNKLATRARRSMNDKGFSLIELVIVIAIMAALIAILAPQYLKYVERSRISADETTADEMVKAGQVAAADPDSNMTADLVITWTATDTVTITGGSAQAIDDVEEALGITAGDVVAKKSTKHDGEKLTITIDADTGVVTVCDLSADDWS